MIQEVRAHDDHCVVLWANLPTCGVVPAGKQEFFLVSIANLLAQYKRNGIAILIHPNRAGDAARPANRLLLPVPRRVSRKAKAEKEEEEDEENKDPVKQEAKQEGSGEEDEEEELLKESPEEADIRTMKHELETLGLML